MLESKLIGVIGMDENITASNLLLILSMCSNYDLKAARKMDRELFDAAAGELYTISEMGDFDIDDKEHKQ